MKLKSISLVLYVFCRSLFVPLYFFFWPLCCLFSFDLQILITPFVIFKLFLETGQKASLCQAFLACTAASANTFYMYRHMYILQCQKVEIEPPKIFWKWKKQVSFLLFSTVSLIMCLYWYLFLSFAQYESGTRKAIFWSVTICNKNLSSQCNFTA